MSNWNSPLRLSTECPPRSVAVLSCLMVLLAGSSEISAQTPSAVAVEAELDAEAVLGASVQILSGNYPPQEPGGWFAFEAGNETGTFLLNETTGAILLNRPDRLATARRSSLVLSIDHGRASETEAQATKRKFLRAAGLSEREISRQLGLVTRYTITLRIKSFGPEFPPRPLHFSWPAEGRTVNEVRAESKEKTRYQLLSQHPEHWIALDPETGMLRLTDEARSSEIPWRGVVEARDASGRTAATSVWITEPLALPSLSMPSLKTFWPEETVAAVRSQASERIQSFLTTAGSWKFDPAKLSQLPKTEPSQPEETPITVSETPSPPENEAQATAIEPGQPVSSTSWYVALFTMVGASLLYMISRHTRSTSDADEKNQKPAPDAEAAKKSARERAFSKAESKPASKEEEFAWEAVLESVADDDSDPDSDDWLSPAASMTTLEMDAPKQNRPLLPAELFASPEELRAALIESKLGPSASAEEVQRLLSLLDDELSSEQQTEDSAIALPAPPIQNPKPGIEPSASDSISDYMNNLLAKYSKPGGKTEPPPVVPVSEPVPAPPKPAPPARTPRPASTGIPEPVCNYDREVTRSQLEQLRETSNLNAAHAIRAAANRRRRQNLLRWSALIAVALVIYAVRHYLVG